MHDRRPARTLGGYHAERRKPEIRKRKACVSHAKVLLRRRGEPYRFFVRFLVTGCEREQTTRKRRMPPRSPRRRAASTPKKLSLHHMPPSAAYPPLSALRRLITQLDQPNTQPPVLSALDVPSYPQPLDACHVLNVREIKAHSSFVLSQSRSDSAGYVTVAGERRETAASAKSWPRTPSGRTKKLVALHRWITAATRQQPPGRDYQASHICGNSRCILAAHLRWQRRHTNKVLDGRFHSERNEGTTRYSRLRWGVSESYKLT